MADYDVLVNMYPDYAKRLTDMGYRGTVLVPPGPDSPGEIRTECSFSQQCGVVKAIVTITCSNGLPVLNAYVARSTIGNRGWGGGSHTSRPANSRDAAKTACWYFAGARDLLH